MKNIFFLTLFSILLFSCGDTAENKTDVNAESTSLNESNLADNFEISGNIFGAVNQPITLEAVSSQGVIKLAQSNVDQDGNFVLKGNIQGMGMYQLRLGLLDNKVVPLTLEPKDKVILKAKYDKFELLPSWSGAKWSKTLTNYMAIYNDFAKSQIELGKKKELTQDQQIAQFLQIRKPMDEFAKNAILADLTNPVNIILTTSLTPAMGYEYWDESYLQVLKKVAISFKGKYKDSPIAESLQSQVKQIEAGLADYKMAKSGKKIAAEIALKDPNGREIKLSSLRGNVVLIDFWASWCGPCRRENPNVVNMYSKYKNKGFTVYSVSLDEDAEAWKRAIKADGLVWPNHVSDLKGWKTPLTQLYNFNSIPFTVLIGKDGKILGTNLRGESLEQKLKEVL